MWSRWCVTMVLCQCYVREVVWYYIMLPCQCYAWGMVSYYSICYLVSVNEEGGVLPWCIILSVLYDGGGGLLWYLLPCQCYMRVVVGYYSICYEGGSGLLWYLLPCQCYMRAVVGYCGICYLVSVIWGWWWVTIVSVMREVVGYFGICYLVSVIWGQWWVTVVSVTLSVLYGVGVTMVSVIWGRWWVTLVSVTLSVLYEGGGGLLWYLLPCQCYMREVVGYYGGSVASQTPSPTSAAMCHTGAALPIWNTWTTFWTQLCKHHSIHMCAEINHTKFVLVQIDCLSCLVAQEMLFKCVAFILFSDTSSQ